MSGSKVRVLLLTLVGNSLGPRPFLMVTCKKEGGGERKGIAYIAWINIGMLAQVLECR